MKMDMRKLNIALANKKMNTSDLARATGYSLTTIREYVTLKRNPNTKSIGKIAEALGVDVTAILEDL